MRIVVDGKSDAPESVATGTVADAYDEVASRMQRMGRTVLDVKLDGHVVTPEGRDEMFGKAAADCECMELETVDTRELAANTLSEVRRHLKPLREALESALETLGAMQRLRALETLKPTLEVWLAVCEAVSKVGILMGRDLSMPVGAGPSVEQGQQQVLAVLEKTQQVFVNQDWVGLADLIEYDFLPLVETWNQICQAMEAEASASGRS